MARGSMRAVARLVLGLGLATAAAASSTTPWGIEFDNDGTGPDGPWTYARVPVDAPSQTLGFFPSLLETTVMANATACQAQTARCVIQNIAAWAGSNAHSLYLNETSPRAWPPSELAGVHGGYVAGLMGLQGSMRYTTQRLTLGEYTLDGVAMAVADNVTATFPNGTWYTVGVGYLSLYGGGEFTYDIANGTQTLPLQLYSGYLEGAYASMSYGLHVGSVTHKIAGKLFYGGYDRARCIAAPITASANATFSLADISLGVAAGGSALLNNTAQAAAIDGLLQTTSSAAALPLAAQPDPGLPYLYLPAATCAAIAAHLPVTYDAGLALYLWDTASPAYERLVSSPHHLSFHFHTSGAAGATQAIAVPLALLNLTLTYPITSASAATPYFPCRPHDPGSSSSGTAARVFLGRAFLQAAHLAQNWHSSTAWLAQAPGPAYAEQDLKTIAAADTTLAELPTADAWNATWAGVLTPLNGSTTGHSSSSGDAGSGLSTGAKAGVGIGVAVGAVAVLGAFGLLWWRRGRRARRRGGGAGEAGAEGDARQLPAELHDGGQARAQAQAQAPVRPLELEGAEVQELPAEDNQVKELHSRPVEKPQELPGGNRYS